MFSFINSPDLQWGDTKDTPVSKGPSTIVDSSFPSLVTPASTKSSTATGTAALAQMAIPPKEPSAVIQVTPHTSKWRHSTSSPPSPLQRLRKVSRAKPPTPPTDSLQSEGVEILPSGPGDSAKPKAISFVSSQKDTIVKSGTLIIPSSTFSLVDKDDLDSSSIQGASSPPHNLSPGVHSPDVEGECSHIFKSRRSLKSSAADDLSLEAEDVLTSSGAEDA
ncbi:hypothetical protein L6452_38083 [Arctium lappa]|uniref:Uncharacterized protein n=1 Tax=Arctium lappa TaxID=4217 RepID=A0ACB8Y5U7_ARCLA|nr:hypothetical protein L6452_38083 [Arctium lappa]